MQQVISEIDLVVAQPEYQEYYSMKLITLESNAQLVEEMRNDPEFSFLIDSFQKLGEMPSI